ncbi:MAG: protein kinase [Verrucomicrobiales bacterium]|nr:protein kinase [Verrucomicrobiales bacterium]
MIFNCPQCRQKLEGDRTLSGSDIACPTCHFHFFIPHQDEDDTVAITPPGTPAPVVETSIEEKYTFHGQIARGGMGIIVSATDKKLNRPVAIKQLAGPEEDPTLVKQLIREAQITARLSHPGIIPIHELGHDAEGRVYYTMKHIRGEPLDKVLEKLRSGDQTMIEKSPFRRLLIIFSRICDAIGYANEKGIIHRDIKPDNIMLAPYGEYLLIDWGIAKDLNNPAPEDPTPVVSAFRYHPEPGDYGATLHGAVFGSPSYMSPEQARGDINSIDARSDVFGLGALLFEILTLSPPYEGETPEEAVKSAAKREIKRISEIRKEAPDPNIPWPHLNGAELPESILAVAMKAMRMEPDERYQSAAELRRDIDAYLAGYTTEAENADFLKIMRLAIKRHKATATALAAGFMLSGLAIGVTATMNRLETVKARKAGAEAVEYIEAARKAREQRLLTRLQVAPDYVEMAKLLANRGEEDNALAVARLASEYDPGLTEATALVKALEMHDSIKHGTELPSGIELEGYPSLAFLSHHPELLTTGKDTEFPEQTLTRLSAAYSEAGLSRLAGQITAGQTARVARYRKELKKAWKGLEIEWDLSLAPAMSSLCLDENLQSLFPGLAKWAHEINHDYPGQILHIAIHQGRKVPDLSILEKLAIESVTFGPGVDCESADLAGLTKCRYLKVLTVENGQLSDLSFLHALPLVALRLKGTSPDLDLSPLAGCRTLRVLTGGAGNRFASLSRLPEGQLQIFSGRVKNGDYSPLSEMPLQVFEVKQGNTSVDLSALASLPLQSFSAKGIDLQKNWQTIASWPLERLSISAPFDVDAGKLNTPLPSLTHLRISEGQWTGNVVQLFPALRVLIDETGRNFGRFSQIDTLESIEVDGDGQCICYLSVLEKVASGKDLYISPDMPVEVLPEAVALNMVKGDWEAAARELKILTRHIAKHPRLTIASINASQLQSVVADRADPEEIYISKVNSRKNHRYQAVFCGLTREQAEQFALAAGGGLAQIESDEEEQFLREMVERRPEYGAFWIGGYLNRPEATHSPQKEAPVLPAGSDTRSSRPASCLFPFVIEWQ